MMDRKKVLELDKICRVCISERKEMRPLFSEKVPEMLMDCTSVRVEPTEGWPDKICVQCVHAVSRNHAFKSLVERSDKELREYIKSLTVRLDQSQAQKQQERKQQKLFQKQLKQQQIEEQQQQQQQQEHQQLLEQQQLQQPIMLMQQEPQQQQQLQHKTKIKPLPRKGVRQAKKQQTSQQLQLLPEPAPPPLQATHVPLQTQHQHQQQLQQLAQLPTLQQAPQQLMPTTTATALPQQILLPNGQLITTAQLVAPQLAQIISTAPHTAPNGAPTTTTLTASPQAQFMPQLLQTPNGQTLQIVQQPNGTQTLQLVQLLPQRSLAPAVTTLSTTTTTSTDMCTTNSNSLADADVQLLDDGEVDEEELDEVYEQLDSKGHTFETIVLDDDQQQDFLKDAHHQVLIDEDLTQSDTQDNEYFEDLDQQQEQVEDMSEQMPVKNDDDDDFIIEEIQLDDDDMLDDGDPEDSVIHVLDQPGGNDDMGQPEDDCEYITDEQEHGIGGDVEDELQYAIMEPPDGEATADIEQAFIDTDAEMQQQQLQHESVAELHGISLENAVVEFSQSTNETLAPTLNVSTPSPTPSAAKRARRSNQQHQQPTMVECNHHQSTPSPISNKLAAANSRQLVQTASVIAAAGADDNYEIDANLVSEFIRQHTSPLGSGRYLCHLCSTEFRQFKGLQNHMHLHTNWIRANCKKQPQCEICLKSFKGPGMLRMHMKTHDAESNTPVCNICNRTFKSKAILYRHRQTHQQRAYCCGVANCRKNFSNAVNLRSHVERKHQDCIDPLYKCGECSTLYDNIDSLQQHVETTDHGADAANAGFSGAVSIVSNGTDMSNLIASAPNTLTTAGSGDTTAVVVGSAGEVYFVTQA
ncbi:zinc finger protein 853 [Scaptodrosophila lebanonensis]|uniref:Zinc finger protein 853 n=1 Tax=Drosophila lebanonensis TaxID=7225 RepID=A0A6J2UK55_DROLE|nr:zinc finger protein 853 [Scaptodrosophila lebanonensis]